MTCQAPPPPSVRTAALSELQEVRFAQLLDPSNLGVSFVGCWLVILGLGMGL